MNLGHKYEARPVEHNPHPDRALRVLAVGDCNTCGITVPPIGNTIVDKFCGSLQRAGRPAVAQNLGCGMATSREGIYMMQHRAVPADIVLINYGLVDCWITSIPQVYISYFPDNRLKKFARKALKWIKRRMRSPLARKFISVGPVVEIAEYRRNIEQIIALARRRNPSVWIALWGTPPVQNDEARNGQILRYNAELQDIARWMQVTYLATIPLIENLASNEAFVDNVHLNEAATEQIASALAHSYFAQCQRAAA